MPLLPSLSAVWNKVALYPLVFEIYRTSGGTSFSPNRIKQCRHALNLIKKDSNSELWSVLQVELGNSFIYSPAENYSQNVELAIEAYRQAMTIWSYDAEPIKWAGLMVNLGLAYYLRIKGNRAENIEQAIKMSEEASRILTLWDFRPQWAQIKCHLGLFHTYRIQGDRNDNLERAIGLCEQAVGVCTPQMQITLSDALNNLGLAYYHRTLGDRSENIEKAIIAYNQSLSIRKKLSMTIDWASTLINLGLAYSYRIKDDRADNVEQAILMHNEALTIIKKDRMPSVWALAMQSLGIAYVYRIQGVRARNIETAIQSFEAALTVRTQDTMPFEWAQTITNMIATYSFRIDDEHSNNVEKAIDFYHRILEIVTQHGMPVEWIALKNNLGLAYLSRTRGNQVENIKNAIAVFEEALEVLTQQNIRGELAQTMDNLGVAYQRMIGISNNQIDYVSKALNILGECLKIRSKQDMPILWAYSMIHLGNVYANEHMKNRSDCIEKAIEIYKEALTVITQTSMPVEWAEIMHNLGQAYTERLQGEHTENRDLALGYYQQALKVRTPDQLPFENVRTVASIAEIHSDRKNWKEAYKYCTQGVQVSSEIFDLAYTDAARLESASVIGTLYIKSAWISLQVEHFNEAVTLIEMSKARILNNALSLSDVNLLNLDDDERQDIKALRNEISSLEYEFRLPIGNLYRRNEQVIADELSVARGNLRRLISLCKTKYPNFIRNGMSLKDILSFVPSNGALLIPLITEMGSAIFVIPSGIDEISRTHIVWLDKFTDVSLQQLSRGSITQQGWLRSYTHYLAIAKNGTEYEKNIALEQLLINIDKITGLLWDLCIQQVFVRLKELGISNEQHLIIMPQSDLSFLPVHAAWRVVNGMKRYFLQDYIISYAPSIASLANTSHSHQIGTGALVAGISQYSKLSSIPYARIEAESIGKLLGVEPLLDDSATIVEIKKVIQGKKFIHFSCHGGFGWGDDPFTSALYLANDEPLTLSDIIANLQLNAAELVVLSACETGIVDFNIAPDEFVGLPAGLMQVGASAVVSTLWSVGDRSTSLLMEQMYQNLLKMDSALTMAQALRQAQLWLCNATAKQIGEYYQSYLLPRLSQNEALEAYIKNKIYPPNFKPYEHPFYWAAFIYSGF